MRFFRGFSSPVRQMSGSFMPPRSPNIIWPSLSSFITGANDLRCCCALKPKINKQTNKNHIITAACKNFSSSSSYIPYALQRWACKNSVHEIRYDCLTARRISSFKSWIFQGLLTYTNDLRVPQRKNHKELSHMSLVVIDDHHYRR